MVWNPNDQNGQNGTRKNPWGTPQGQGPHNKGSGRPNPNQGPDLEDMVRRAQAQFGGMFPGGQQGFFIGILIALFLWLGSGVFRVSPGENAVVQVFGALSHVQQNAGLGYHLPWPIGSVRMLNVTLDRRITIGFQGDGVGTKSDIPEESMMLTADANIVDIDVVVLWNISEAEKYVFNIRNQENTIKRVAESTIREVVGQTAIQPIITDGRDDVSARIQSKMQAVLDSYGSGVAIRQVLIQEATVHPAVIEAYSDVAAAKQDAERFQNEATIYRNDIIPRARGEAIKLIQDAEAYKQDVMSRAEGDAKRFISTYEAYKTGREVTRDRLYIETMEQIFGNANTTIIDQEGNGGIVPYLPLEKAKRSALTDNTTPAQ